MPAIKLCYSKLDFESRLAKGHATTIALKRREGICCIYKTKKYARYLYCPVRFLQTGTYGCNMASFSLHDGTSLSTKMLLVSKARQSLSITVASFLFSKVIKTTPAWLTEDGLGVLILIKTL